MRLKTFFTLLLNILMYQCVLLKKNEFVQTNPSAKFHNPNFVRDRFKDLINKPEMPELWKQRYRKPFNPAWMDYCDPYHCNDYHKVACGLNRNTMKFKWFQSVCHIIMNNMCSTYRGTLKYDVVDPKYCKIYVTYLRDNCPTTCKYEEEQTVCGISYLEDHILLFDNECSLDEFNCAHTIQQGYEKMDNKKCEQYIQYNTITD